MSDKSKSQADRENFDDYYLKERTAIKKLIQIEALGTDLGMDGYTTVEQAEKLQEKIALTSESCLLDIGAGRGWPGTHIAQASGCKLVSTDIPWESLVDTKFMLAESDYEGCREVVNADGRALAKWIGVGGEAKILSEPAERRSSDQIVDPILHVFDPGNSATRFCE